MANNEFSAPDGPPPLLSEDQLFDLARLGWLPLQLNDIVMQHANELFETTRVFFAEQNETKVHTYPPREGTEFGYYRVEDEKEYVTLRCQVHPKSDLETKAMRLWQELANILHRILCDISQFSSFPLSIWDDMLEDTLDLPSSPDRMTPTLMRLFTYFPRSGYAAPHTDLGLLTICLGEGRGLQVSDLRQQPPVWVDVSGPVVLTGEVLKTLSGDTIRPGLHRVVKNPDGRQSIVFALRPSLKNKLKLADFGASGEMDMADLWERIRSRKYNINAVKSVRDEQRQKMSFISHNMPLGQG